MHYIVILAGGVGKRISPISNGTPKYLLKVPSFDKSMLRLTVERVLKYTHNCDKIKIVTNVSVLNSVKNELPELKDDSFIVESEQNDTFQAAFFAAKEIYKNDEDAVITIVPSDQLIDNEFDFCECLSRADNVAKNEGKLVVLGSKTNELNPELGYIIDDEFVEKPTVDFLNHAMKKHRFLVKNTGNYTFKADNLFKWTQLLYKTTQINELPKLSFDKALSEKLKNGELFTICANFDFLDLGTPESFEKSVAFEIGKDSRNLVDNFKNMEIFEIVNELEKTRSGLHVAIENWDHDFNMGSIVRSANAFNVSAVHIIGRRRWNSRGAMKTETYLNVYFHKTVASFVKWANGETEGDAEKENERAPKLEKRLPIIGIDILKGISKPIEKSSFERECIFLFGSEQSGLSSEAQTAALNSSNQILHITQFGTTRSLNAAHAASIAIYEHARRFL